MRVPIASSSISKAAARRRSTPATGPLAPATPAVPAAPFAFPLSVATRPFVSSPSVLFAPNVAYSAGVVAPVFGDLRSAACFLSPGCGLNQKMRFFSVTPPPVYNGNPEFVEDQTALYPQQDMGYDAASPYASAGAPYDASSAMGAYAAQGAPGQAVPGYAPPYGAPAYGGGVPQGGAPYGAPGVPAGGYYAPPPQVAPPAYGEEAARWGEVQPGHQQGDGGYWGGDEAQRHMAAQGYAAQMPGYSVPGAYPPPAAPHGVHPGAHPPHAYGYPATTPAYPAGDQSNYYAAAYPQSPQAPPGGYPGGFGGAAPQYQRPYYGEPQGVQAPGAQGATGQPGDESARFQERMMELLQRRLGHKAWLYESALKKGGPEGLLRLANDPEVLMHARSTDLVYILTRFHHSFRMNRVQLAAGGGADDAASVVGDGAGADGASEAAGAEEAREGGAVTQESDRILAELAKFINNVRVVLKRRDARSEVGLQPFRQTSAERREGEGDAQHKIGKGFLLDRARVFHLLAALTLPECSAARALSRPKLYSKIALPFCAIASEEASVFYDLDVSRVRGGVVATMELLRLVGFTGRISHFQHLILEDVPATTPNAARDAGAEAAALAVEGSQDADEKGARDGEEPTYRRVPVDKDDSRRIWEKLAQVYIGSMDQIRLEHLLPAFTGISVLFEKDMISRPIFLQVVSELCQRMVVPNAFGQNEARGGAALQLLLEQCTNTMRCQQQNQRLGFSSLRALARIMRETRSDVVIRCLSSLSLLRCLREENLGFFSSVLLKRHYRQDVAARQLSPRTLAALIFTHAMTGSRAGMHVGELTKVMTSMMGTVERERVISTEDKCKLAWAICALRLYSREESAGQWDEKLVASLLRRLMEQTKGLNGRLSCYFLEAARECRDAVEEMHPGQGFKEFFPADRIDKVTQDYDRFGYYAMRTDVALLRRALLTSGATVKVSADRQRSQEKASFSSWGEAEGESEETGSAKKEVEPKDTQSEQESLATSQNTPSDDATADWIRGSVWEEGTLLDGYPVAFYCPEKKIAADIDRPARLPAKYMKMRHMQKYLEEQGIRYIIYSEELRLHHEDTFTGFLTLIQNPDDKRATLAAVPKNAREMWTKRSGSGRAASEDGDASLGSVV
ncbi:hypothetical protein BESB_035380 [Besnoitia besnoiti]|uniref:RAP domain-containing protein n=1 Tax=Besnoitia besnoiti TaxID=94643 RepID=A0A2A9MN57_BESBE|nr:hypothetical protein BESB_035380 [Besnoitia besnoiti]PFH37080.1 hypothetical protein BESB_035380 [Besnoitia besnoiti]